MVSKRFIEVAFCLFLCWVSTDSITAQDRADIFSEPDYFFHGALSEATAEVVSNDGKFMLFVYDPLDTAMAHYYLDTLFLAPEITSNLKRNFLCIAADSSSAKGKTLKEQFRIQEFPAIIFADRRGQEFYSAFGRLESDQMFDICERAAFD